MDPILRLYSDVHFLSQYCIHDRAYCILAMATVYRLDSKTFTTLYLEVQSIPSWLVWTEFECTVHVTNRSIKEFQPV